MNPRKPFTVEVNVTQTRTYEVFARSQEEAESIVETEGDELDFDLIEESTEINSTYPTEEPTEPEEN